MTHETHLLLTFLYTLFDERLIIVFYDEHILLDHHLFYAEPKVTYGMLISE